ncbi:MAG: GGDEF domain-containing protein [Desulfuromonadales bacterium]
MNLVAKILVFCGALIILGSLFPTRQLISQLPGGRIRTSWYAMLLLEMVFLLGYLGYAWVVWHTSLRLIDLIVPVVFFLGSCFVCLTAILSLQTARTIGRVDFLERENMMDATTGIFNRRYLEHCLNKEVERAWRYDLPLSVLMVDIDHFKQVNDRYGHLAGDEVLCSFAKLLKREIRDLDIVARFGGEEFLVIAPQTSSQGALDLAERLRSCVESSRFTLSEAKNPPARIALTCSIGVATLCEEVDCQERLVYAADENLYRAKRDGRNRVNADKPSKDSVKPRSTLLAS